MREEDYLWCAVNLLLDEEEVARQLCPQCREAAQEMVSLTEQVRPRPEGWSLYAQLGQARQIAQAAMGGREVTPFALTESLEQRTTADWGELDRAVQRDARRYDGGFFLY